MDTVILLILIVFIALLLGVTFFYLSCIETELKSISDSLFKIRSLLETIRSKIRE